MTDPIDGALVRREVLDLFDETFATHHGIYLDRGTSLFETLEGVDAELASRASGATSGTLAAKVAHVTLYVELLGRYIETGDGGGPVDWGEIWRTVGAVTPEAWAALVEALHAAHDRVRTMLVERGSWADEATLSGAMAITVHTAYHLGEIREALAALQG